MKDETYSLHELAEFTGLTERTLRNYLNQGLLRGEKQDGAWRFTAQQLAALLKNSAVHPSIQSKAASAVYDFLLDKAKPSNQMCVVLDLHAPADEADAISAFFCDRIHVLPAEEPVRLHYLREKEQMRVILTGHDRQVMALLQQFYSNCASQKMGETTYASVQDLCRSSKETG